MTQTMKAMLKKALATVDLGYCLARGIDYRALSRYVLEINKHRRIDAILADVSKCLKDLLCCDLWGFAYKRDQFTEIWMPRGVSSLIGDYIMNDCNSQNIDCRLNYFVFEAGENRHNLDAPGTANLISFDVHDEPGLTRLYVVSNRKITRHHEAVMRTICLSIGIALEKNLNIEQLENAAAVDPLTNCYNRRAFSAFLEKDIASSRRKQSDLSIILFDMDNFKEINDLWGHLAGDSVLKQVSSMVSALVRKSDYLVRYGGEEFVLVLPDTPLYHAVQVATKLRTAIERQEVPVAEGGVRITASFGVASLEDKSDSVGLLREADQRLYTAKAIGKNCVVPSLVPCFADKRFVSGGYGRRLNATRG